MKKTTLAILALFLAGCVSQSQVYINPDRQTVRCAAVGAGITGMVASGISMSNCDTDYRNMGYIPIDESGVTGIWMAKPDGSLEITKVIAGSPAAKADIKAGDFVVSVNGEKPLNAKEAVKLLFGKSGATVTVVLKGSPAPRTVDLTLVPYLTLYGPQSAK
ncbi:S41 family peptidase [Flavobacterium sp.]|jgi:C-terminal processing protease CtpA/Prc|uniref:S41 family peptidase n=1 Tax=Flavobacterium sp. TaxID=239 RepID=UPI0037BFB4BC